MKYILSFKIIKSCSEKKQKLKKKMAEKATEAPTMSSNVQI